MESDEMTTSSLVELYIGLSYSLSLSSLFLTHTHAFTHT